MSTTTTIGVFGAIKQAAVSVLNLLPIFARSAEKGLLSVERTMDAVYLHADHMALTTEVELSAELKALKKELESVQ